MGPWPGPGPSPPAPTTVTPGRLPQKSRPHSPAWSPDWRAAGPRGPREPKSKCARKRGWRQPACPEDPQTSGSSSRPSRAGPGLAGEASVARAGGSPASPHPSPTRFCPQPQESCTASLAWQRGQAGLALAQVQPPHPSPQSPGLPAPTSWASGSGTPRGSWAQSWGPTCSLSPGPNKDAELRRRHFTEETTKPQGHP